MAHGHNLQEKAVMAEMPMQKLIPMLAVPTIMANLITTIYNLVDAYFVSTLGTNATAAVGVNGSLEDTLTLIGPLIGSGACSYIARLLGEKKSKTADEVLSTSFFTGVGIGALLMFAGLLSINHLVYWLGATEDCAAYSIEYARYVLLAAPFMIGNYILSVCLRSEGSAMRAMIGVGAGGIINCILDPIFIFQLDMGVAGASIATAISKLISFCILIYPYVFGKCIVNISLKRFRYTKNAVREVLAIGATAFIRSVLMVFSGIVMNWVASGYSVSTLAAISVTTRVMRLPFAVILGFGQGYQPAAGFCWGAKQYGRVREGLKFGSIVSVVGAAVMGVILAVAASPVIRLFNSQADAEVLRIGVLCVRFQCITLPVFSWVSTINMFYAAIGSAKNSLLVSTARQGYCLAPTVLILPRVFGVNAIAACQAVSDILSLVVAVPLGIKAFQIVNRLSFETKDLEKAALEQ